MHDDPDRTPENTAIRVAVVIPNYGLVGGAENLVFELTERLARRGPYEIHVLANRWRAGEGRVRFHRIPIIPFPRWMKPVSFAAFAARSLTQGRYDIVHSHDRVPNADLFSFHGVPHRLWVRDARAKRMSLFDRATDWVERRAVSGANPPLILPVSTLARDALVQTYPRITDRIRVLHPGVSCTRFAPNREAGQVVRRRHGLPSRDVVLLFVSMNFELKRLDVVIRALALLPDGTSGAPAVRLLVVGKGREGPYQRLARRLGVEARITFGGVVRDAERYYAAADIFVLPSRYDTFGLVVLEAMAAGLPAIVSDRVGARDMIRSGANGFVLSAVPSPEELSSAVGSLLDSEVRQTFGRRARRTAEGQSWERVTEHVSALYGEILQRRKRRPAE
jgi:UDP-glucose:(heptosyl)LPS alpha-1,3-glucosyltransferase